MSPWPAGVLASVAAHGAAGSWDEFALLLLAPLVVAGVLWVTRRGAAPDSDEPDEAEEHSATDPQ